LVRPQLLRKREAEKAAAEAAAARAAAREEEAAYSAGWLGGVELRVHHVDAVATRLRIAHRFAGQIFNLFAQSSGPSSSSRNDTVNYELDRTIRHTKLNVGDVVLNCEFTTLTLSPRVCE
jgi:flagellar biosynthesis/type III secretory pathway M-ring protein FliF/YscJ